jgi:hypothetical protein
MKNQTPIQKYNSNEYEQYPPEADPWKQRMRFIQVRCNAAIKRDRSLHTNALQTPPEILTKVYVANPPHKLDTPETVAQ